MDKVVKDGKVAVLYSPGFGAGWSTWHTEDIAPIFDPETVEWVLAGRPEQHPDWKEKFGEYFYEGGAYSLEVEWLPIGTSFRVEEYDGNEHIVLSTAVDWVVA